MVSTFFYNLIISPIYNILEFFYVFFSAVTSKGLSVIALSFVVTLFCLPLYMIAEKWQKQERDTQEKLKSGIKRIKKAFKGDEQYMILNTFYRENHYSPIYALRSSFSLLIQIPFFIAAYSFLSNLEELQGYSFLFIKDFGSPDHFAFLGEWGGVKLWFNILPVLMTLINLVSGLIYSKGHALSEKIQILVFALVFLVILYDSPSALVVYWTMNNILSLVKNIFFKLKNPGKIFHILCCSVLFLGIIWAFSTGKKIYIIGMIILFALVLCYFPVKNKIVSFLDSHFLILDEMSKKRDFLFLFSAFSLAFLTGFVIPSFVMESSPSNFCYIDSYKSPFVFLFVPFIQALGLYFFWPFAIYKLFSKRFKKALSLIFPAIFICSVVNCFFFSSNYGSLNDDLTFMHEVVFPPLSLICLNIFIIVLIFALVFFLIAKKIKIASSVLSIFFISCLALSVKNVIFVGKTYKNMSHTEKNKIESIYHFSKSEQNVLVIMQDACVSPLVFSAFEESEDLKSLYDGFTFYPNTVSMSHYTQLGVPGVFGGYDFTPYEMNKRNQTIQQKHNEAILTMPTLFSEAGFSVTVSDLPYENYGEEPVEEIYKDIPDVNRQIAKRVYNDVWYKMNEIEPYPVLSELLKRNFIYLSLFKIVPNIFHPIVFHRNYWRKESSKIDDKFFNDSYSQLDLMKMLSDTDSSKPSFILLDNETTHEARYLNPQDYSPFLYDNGKKRYLSSDEILPSMHGSSLYKDSKSFHAANAILRRWSDFFQYLKEEGCYDNTRIIIVSDHGQGDNSGQFKNDFEKFPFMKESVTATLLVKDFNSHGKLKYDYNFMTNADTPSLAVKDIIKNAKNPFTGNLLEVSDSEKAGFVKIAVAPLENLRIRNNTKYKVNDSQWYTVKENIFNEENWAHYTQE